MGVMLLLCWLSFYLLFYTRRKACTMASNIISKERLALLMILCIVLIVACDSDEPTIGPGAKLRDADFSGQDLSGVDLTGADMVQIYLVETDLRKANLSGADMTKAALVKANLGGANLTGANLSGANLTEVNFSRANLAGANLNGANLTQANFSGVSLAGENLSGANLTGVDLSGFNLTGTNFSGADLTGANFSGANLTGANLSRAIRASSDSVSIQNRFIQSKAEFHEANLTEADLSDADLREAVLVKANLSGANLAKANLSKANLTEADLSGAILSKAILSGANLTGAKLNVTDLTGADFSKTNFTDAEIDREILANLLDQVNIRDKITTGSADNDIIEVFKAIRKVCEGVGLEYVTQYAPEEPRLHPVLIIGPPSDWASNKPHEWNYLLPREWLPLSLRSIELVLCIEPVERKEVERCHYVSHNGLGSYTRIFDKLYLPLRLLEARTGEIIHAHEIWGGDPEIDCPSTLVAPVGKHTAHVSGDPVEYAEAEAFLRRFVAP